MANGAFVPGTGDLKSTDLINAFLELAMLTQTEERIALTNEAVVTANGLTVPDNIVISANFNTDIATVSIAALPVDISLVSGNIQIEAVDYLEPINAVVPTVNNALDVTGADLTKTNKVQALLELAQLIQVDEEVAGLNNLTLSINTDNSTASINAVFSGVPQVNASGHIEFIADNYLA
ncbi:hypothetical protein VKI21_12490 [Cyanobacterium aponinum UTEX 3222]|uniref:hypothetical protein n=1 Tax=Cyanobacterium aponinum TaxID=379064 RepID=UPI00308CC481|nr:hypothetical protein VKI21_12490 [Cyanobacterium aponinum UTEX 3222]